MKLSPDTLVALWVREEEVRAFALSHARTMVCFPRDAAGYEIGRRAYDRSTAFGRTVRVASGRVDTATLRAAFDAHYGVECAA